MKFGGDCLSTPNNQLIVKDIVSSYDENILLVCSAMGRDGFPYSTSSLEKLVDEENILSKEKDRLISCGEIISSIRLSYLLNYYKINSYSLSYKEIGFNCDSNYGNGNVLFVNKNKIEDLLKTHKVLIIPGFIGESNENEVITLGKGNSDLTSVLVSNAFHQKIVYLYKNVDGVYHTSPSVYRQLKLFEFISYNEMLSLIDIGFGIVSKKAILEAEKNNIVIEIRNYLTNKTGTIISNKMSNDLIIGFNIDEKKVKIATFNPSRVKLEINKVLVGKHIFIKNEVIVSNMYCFEVGKSMINIVKKVLMDFIISDNK